MAAMMEVWGKVAVIAGYHWRCQDPQLEKLLNAMLDPYGPTTSDPAPDLTAAQQAASALGGRVVRATAPRPRQPKAVY